MLLRRLTFFFLLSGCISSLYVSSETQGGNTSHISIIDQIESGGNVNISCPEKLDSLLSYHKSGNQSVETEFMEEENSSKSISRVGYRVQVFEDNNVRTAQHMAQERKKMLESRFPEFRPYIRFDAPYWRVRVGDFHTRSEAEAALGAIRSAFPSIGSQLRVVRDKINSQYY